MKKDEEFPGVLIVDELTFERIKRDLQKPGKPTDSIMRGAKLLRDLYSGGPEKGDDDWKTNRVRKTQPSVTGPYWCAACDRWLVREGEKCPGCGHRRKTKKAKP